MNRAYGSKEELREYIRSVWYEMTSQDHFGDDANFFSIGGSSLLYVRMILRVSYELDMAIDLEAILHSPTLTCLVEFLWTAQTSKDQKDWFEA